ncbi:MAG: amidohydrolase [Alphaproteobacteria bacterium]|nr:amidohydrolase [Alphaproteobacteria bacterium]
MLRRALPCTALALLLIGAAPVTPQLALDRIDRDAKVNTDAAKAIWDFAEVGYQETQSSALLQKRLKDAGFKIDAGVAGIPTAFTATYGTGGPVIAILGEFDALPGITQDASPTRSPRTDRKAGHACGHHLFGVASASAAIAVADWLKATGTKGTIRFYGTPAEEGGAGKVYMVRDGLFRDVDIAFHWHPGAENSADMETSNANKSAKFRFRGVSAHAASAPERGRSALDGVEAMNMMANMMREHMPQDARLHYVITAGGNAPNVVPDYAEVFYYVRHPNPALVAELFERLTKIAEGAALGTGTKVDHEVIHGANSLLPNRALQTMVHAKMTQVGGVKYDASDLSWAQTIFPTLQPTSAKLSDAGVIQPLGESHTAGSTDVGDVSWTVPTAGFRTATWVPGTAAHSWQAVAAGGMSIGAKGMQNAAKVLALSAIELYQSPQTIAAAKAEFAQRRGEGYVYKSLVGDRKPPLDYRK